VGLESERTMLDDQFWSLSQSTTRGLDEVIWSQPSHEGLGDAHAQILMRIGKYEAAGSQMQATGRD
jgi:hypothetical protein